MQGHHMSAAWQTSVSPALEFDPRDRVNASSAPIHDQALARQLAPELMKILSKTRIRYRKEVHTVFPRPSESLSVLSSALILRNDD